MVILEQINEKLYKKRKKSVQISEYLDRNLVSFLESNTKDEAINSLVDCLDRYRNLENRDSFHKAILKREAIISTGIGIGIAIPHAKIDGLDDFFITVGIQKKRGLDWNSIDGVSVKIIFMIGGPDDMQDEYLKILSKLTMIIKDETLRKKLIRSEEKKEVIDLLINFEKFC